MATTYDEIFNKGKKILQVAEQQKPKRGKGMVSGPNSSFSISHNTSIDFSMTQPLPKRGIKTFKSPYRDERSTSDRATLRYFPKKSTSENLRQSISQVTPKHNYIIFPKEVCGKNPLQQIIEQEKARLGLLNKPAASKKFSPFRNSSTLDLTWKNAEPNSAKPIRRKVLNRESTMGAVLEHSQQCKPEKKERTFKVTQVNGSEVFRATKTNVMAEQLKYSKGELNMMWPSRNQMGPAI
jgi:hypothetical protein